MRIGMNGPRFSPDEGGGSAFDFDFSEPTPAPSEQPAAQPEATPAPAIDPAQVAQLQARLAAQEKRQQDLARFLAGGDTAQPQQPDPQASLAALAQNPDAYVEQRASQIVEQKLAAMQLRQEMLGKYPEMAPIEPAVITLAQTLYQQAQAQGQFIDDRSAIEQAIQRIKGVQAPAQPQAQAQQLRTAALSYNPAAGSGAPPAQGPPDFEKMSNAEFAQYRANFLRSKGISA